MMWLDAEKQARRLLGMVVTGVVPLAKQAPSRPVGLTGNR